MPYIEVEPNVKIFAQDWGSGKPLVFISGWPFDHRCYEYQFNQLPKHGYRCIGIDMRGFGRSDRPWDGYSYDVFAEDILKVLRQLNVTDATLIGHSMGGAISLRYLAHHAHERISKLILMGAAAPIWTQRPSYPYGLSMDACNELLKLCYTDRAQLLENFGKIFFYSENSISPKFAEWIQHMGMEASGHATAKCIIALRDTDLRADLKRITVPTAIMHSPHDKICPFDFANVMNKGITHSTIIRFENSGHGLFYDEWEKCNLEIMKFVEKQIEKTKEPTTMLKEELLEDLKT